MNHLELLVNHFHYNFCSMEAHREEDFPRNCSHRRSQTGLFDRGEALISRCEYLQCSQLSPVKLLCDKFSPRSSVKFPNPGGIIPVSWLQGQECFPCNLMLHLLLKPLSLLLQIKATNAGTLFRQNCNKKDQPLSGPVVLGIEETRKLQF
ncbi:hypothetical protein V6N12_002813 [Hibiscus sabdariffa]|uniref:Uncharacterized protein n=1 Tax=Hibiscus sabdariffa TaxID=183260 RepID=A0ABR2EA28_9ROSI